jgi:erythrin-vacuolar iron transport family protein
MTDVVAGQVPAADSLPEESQGRGPEYHTAEQRFILQIIQPGLVGLMDGSVSTLAPLFATAFATKGPHTAFLVGLAAAVGAAISMAFSEAMSDTGELTGRGRPVTRGAITGLMTFVGGVGHTLPFLLPTKQLALTFAYFVVGVELVAIAMVRYRFFKMNFFLSIVQVVVGGALVFTSGVLIGSSA